MKILAEIDGWQKIMEVPDHCKRSGILEISKTIPPHLTPNSGPPVNEKVPIFRLLYTGLTCYGLPLFKWEDL